MQTLLGHRLHVLSSLHLTREVRSWGSSSQLLISQLPRRGLCPAHAALSARVFSVRTNPR